MSDNKQPAQPYSEIMNMSSKNFGSIRDDYDFFEEYSTESEKDLLEYSKHLLTWNQESRPIHMLDFGCGSGKFAEQFLSLNHLFQKCSLFLTLVEPDEIYLQQAVERLQPFTSYRVQQWSNFPLKIETETRFDLVLANHVFYYVDNLMEVLSLIISNIAARGIFLTAMAGQSNSLMQLCFSCFHLIEKPFPYKTAEDLEVTLLQLGEKYSKQDVRYSLVFPDSKENRLKILRFVLGDYFKVVPRQPMLELFNNYSHGNQIVLHTTHSQYVIQY